MSQTSSASMPSKPGHSSVAPNEIAVGVVIGRTSEYFDFFVYGIASVLIFPQLFFPFTGQLQGMLYAFMVFALAFVARPFGTALFMWIQRQWGRASNSPPPSSFSAQPLRALPSCPVMNNSAAMPSCCWPCFG